MKSWEAPAEAARQRREAMWEDLATRDPSECWEWPMSRFPDGYGQCQHQVAHRISWERFRGPIPDGLWVLHHCDNPPCVNPDHLYLGDRWDNARDKVVRGRSARGEQLSPRLTPQQVLEIRAACDQGQMRKDVAEQYGISSSAASYIALRRTWAWLPEVAL